jgi:glycosyltransferase involved in cell wall biosynthesis
MRLGVITKDEEYWSLRNMTRSYLGAIGSRMKFRHLELPRSIDPKDAVLISKIDRLYKDSDAIFYTSSKSLFFRRKYPKPTIFIGYAWLDHFAGLNLYFRRDSYTGKDILALQCHADIEKYRLIFSKRIQPAYLPFFIQDGQGIDALTEGRIAMLKRLTLPDKKIILYSGRLAPEKRTLDLIMLYKEIRRRCEDCCLVLAGDWVEGIPYPGKREGMDEYRRNVLRAISDERIPDVHFLGPQPAESLASLYRNSYLFINMTTCFEENFGMAQIEAQKRGLPVVCTDWAGLKDTVMDEVTGIKLKTAIAAGNTIRISWRGRLREITRLLEDRRLRDSMSANGRRLIDKNFSDADFLAKFSKLLDKISKGSVSAEGRGKVLFGFCPSVRPIYMEIIKRKSYGSMYDDHPKLYKYLYGPYASE